MNRNQILDEYEINEGGVIQSPGKFEAEMLYAPYFYEALMDGLADDRDDTDPDCPVATFVVSADDLAEFPELGGAMLVKCWEDTSGFFYCATEPE
jgi:hypothetical protein